MGRHIGLPLRNGNPTAVPLFHAYAVYHLHPSPCGKRVIHKRVENRRLSTLVRPRAQRQHSPHAAACEILSAGYAANLHRRSAVPLLSGGFLGRCKRFLTTYILFERKKPRQRPRFRVLSARYAKNYFFRTTSPPRPVCAVMYSRPILAYSNGLALAGSCSASTMIQPV